MAGTLNKLGFSRLILEDIVWLQNACQDSPERRHIIECLEELPSLQYDEYPIRALTHFKTENGVENLSRREKAESNKTAALDQAVACLMVKSGNDLLTLANALWSECRPEPTELVKHLWRKIGQPK